MTSLSIPVYRPANGARYSALLLIVAAHLLLIWVWPTSTIAPLAIAQRILFLQLSEPLQRLREPAPRDTAVSPRKTQRPPDATANVPTIAPPAAPAPAESPANSSAVTSESVIQNALRDIGKIDSELRKGERKLPSVGPPTNITGDRIARAIASAAHVPDGTMVEHIFPDGTRMTRMKSGKGYICFTMKSAGANDGIDHIQNGYRLSVPMSCGHYFDGVP